MQLYLECYCAYRRHQGCHCINGDFGASPIFGQLSDKPLLASIWLCGVSSSLAPGSQQALCRFPGSRLSRGRPDCVAGHTRLELKNVGANYPFEKSHRFVEIQPNASYRDYSRLSCGVGRRSSSLCQDRRTRRLPEMVGSLQERSGAIRLCSPHSL
jgi:hypothetical protein